MKTLKFFLLWIVVTIVMIISWSVGAWVGNAITNTQPPPVDDPASVGFYVMLICLLNSLVWSILFHATRPFTGVRRSMSCLIYLFGTQFFLMQMETLFFASSLTISPSQVIGILVAGFFMVGGSCAAGLWLTRSAKTEGNTPFGFEIRSWQEILLPIVLLCVLAYPLLYWVFGYFVAWQNEDVRILYSQSAELRPFLAELPGYFSTGLYFFQILRAILWVAISIPVVLMLRQYGPFFQYIFFGLLSALPSIQLFIPNPYMSAEVAMAHFAETSTSNFLWGVLIVYTTNEWVVRKRVIEATIQESTLN